jgi:hypothetical protein
MATAQAIPAGVQLMLNLSVLEANVLKAMMQNPLSESETEVEKQLRFTIFNAMTNAGIV